MATRAKDTTVVIPMVFDRETKGTFRFAEDAEPERQVIRTLYVSKKSMRIAPEKLTVTISY